MTLRKFENRLPTNRWRPSGCRWSRIGAEPAGPGSPERARYLFREGRGVDGTEPPNNWQSIFGGPAWTRTTNPDGTPGEWFLHLFDSRQPDLDWEHPEVRSEIRRAVEAANAGLSRVERVKRFAILPHEWVPGGDELTPTLKLKRRAIATRYAAEIDELYSGGSGRVSPGHEPVT